MSLPPALSLLRVPAYVAAATSILAATLAQGMAGTYMILVAVERAGMSPLQLSVFLTAAAASGIVMTALFGRWLDRHPRRWPLLVALISTVLGYGLIAFVTDVVVLIVIAATLLGLAAPAFPLLFGIAKRHLDGQDPRLASSGMAALRMIASLAWAIGPALGALCFALWGYTGVNLGGAGFGLVALIVVLTANLRPLPAEDVEAHLPAAGIGRAMPAAIAMVLFHSAMFLGSTAMVVVVVRDLAGSEIDVGLLFSLCAGLEVVLMSAFVVLPARRASRAAIAVGFGLFAAYFVAPLLWPSLATLYWTQIIRAAAIAILSVLGMMHLQDLMPTRPGAAAALFANATNASFLISGLTAGAWAAFFGYWSIFGLSAALAIAGIGVIALSPPTPHAASSSAGSLSDLSWPQTATSARQARR